MDGKPSRVESTRVIRGNRRNQNQGSVFTPMYCKEIVRTNEPHFSILKKKHNHTLCVWRVRVCDERIRLSLSNKIERRGISTNRVWRGGNHPQNVIQPMSAGDGPSSVTVVVIHLDSSFELFGIFPLKRRRRAVKIVARRLLHRARQLVKRAEFRAQTLVYDLMHVFAFAHRCCGGR